MKNNKLLFLPLIALTTLPSCGGVDTAHAIIAPINYNAKDLGLYTAYNIDMYQLYSLLETKQSFALEIYLDSCSHCRDFGVTLDKYIKETGYQIYRFQPDEQEELDFIHNTLAVDFPDIFEGFNGVPTFQLINDGKLTYTFSPNKFSSLTAFKAIAKKHFIPAHLYSVSDAAGIESFILEHKEYFLYAFDYTSDISAKIMTEIYDYELKNKKNVVVLDVNSMVFDNYVEIANYFEISPTNSFAIYSKDGKIEKTANYLIDDGIKIKDFLASYFA